MAQEKRFRHAAVGGMLLLVAATSGCLNQGGGLAPSTLPITERDVYTVIGPAVGTDGTITLFSLPLLPVSGHGAIQEAKSKTGADGLVDVTVENQLYLYPLPIGYYRIKVAGKAIKFQRDMAN